MHLCYMLALYFYWICSFITFLRVLIANQTALVTYCSQRCSLISLPGCDTHEWTNGIGIYTGGAAEKKIIDCVLFMQGKYGSRMTLKFMTFLLCLVDMIAYVPFENFNTFKKMCFDLPVLDLLQKKQIF